MFAKNGDADSHKWRWILKENGMYQLNFPNGNVQTYNSLDELNRATKAMGGKVQLIGGKTYVFVKN